MGGPHEHIVYSPEEYKEKKGGDWEKGKLAVVLLLALTCSGFIYVAFGAFLWWFCVGLLALWVWRRSWLRNFFGLIRMRTVFLWVERWNTWVWMAFFVCLLVIFFTATFGPGLEVGKQFDEEAWCRNVNVDSIPPDNLDYVAKFCWERYGVDIINPHLRNLMNSSGFQNDTDVIFFS